MDEYVYPARFTRAAEGGWEITFRDLPDAISQAEDHEDVIDLAEGCLQATIEGRLLYRRPIPGPSAPRAGEVLVAVPIETATKAALLTAVAASGNSRAALARALRIDEKEIRRMLDPRHSSKLPRVARVLKALGKELRLTVTDAPKPPTVREKRGRYRVAAKKRRAKKDV